MFVIPNEHENPNGLHQRYVVMKKTGPTDPLAVYFVLRLDKYDDDPEHVAACRHALSTFALNTANKQLAADCVNLLRKLASQDE